MNSFETSATVEDQGQVRLTGVPFAPGTEVEVTISPKPGPVEAQGVGDAGLRWEGNVLVHAGVGAVWSAADSRDERLNRLSEGLSG